jgi:hypothetical protein
MNVILRNLGCLELWWLGGIYSPQPPTSRLGKAAVDGRQPRHPTVRVLEQSTVGGFVFKRTRQSGAPPDRYCSLPGAPLTLRL